MFTTNSPIVTAGLRPDLFDTNSTFLKSRTLMVIVLSVLVLASFGLRVTGLSSEGLSEDELNKLNAVADYRAHGLTSANGEHPFLMKALLTVSVIAAERWNDITAVAARPQLKVPVETSLRFPQALFGALTVILMFLMTSELFGREAGLIAAALWAFDPLAIGFNRIAKEDTLLVFFFLLGNVFWVLGQRVAESRSDSRPERYYWATAAAFGAMLASKLFPQLIAITAAYNYIFQRIPTRWVMGKVRFIKFFAIAGVVFAICSPTIFLPGTWRTMLNFASLKMVGHDSYEFMGLLYPHKYINWLRGEPWYFYFVLIGVKLPLLTLLGFVSGFVILFRKRIGDGRYLLIFWLFFWAITFTFEGGKFTRYLMSVMPAIIVVAALGIQFLGRWLESIFSRVSSEMKTQTLARLTLPILAVIASLWSAATAAPHYRLFMNALGGASRAGYFFPQDEFYDAYMQDTMKEVARRAPAQTRVGSELPTVAAYYATRVNRPDLQCLELSDPVDLKKLMPGDFLIDGRGRTYFSNQAMLLRLRQAARPAFTISVGASPAADVYILDQKSLTALRGE